MLKIIVSNIAATVALLTLVNPANAVSLVTGIIEYQTIDRKESDEFTFDLDSEKKIGQSFVYDLIEFNIPGGNGTRITPEEAIFTDTEALFVLTFPFPFGSTAANVGRFVDKKEGVMNDKLFIKSLLPRNPNTEQFRSALFTTSGRTNLFNFTFEQPFGGFSVGGSYTASAPVPEPITMAGAALAAGGLSFLRRKRQCQKN